MGLCSFVETVGIWCCLVGSYLECMPFANAETEVTPSLLLPAFSFRHMVLAKCPTATVSGMPAYNPSTRAS